MRKLVRSLLFASFLLRGGTGAVSFREEITFLLFPPENLTKQSSLAWVGEALVLSVSNQLEKRGLEVLSRESRLNFVEDADLPPARPLSKASMIRVAQLADADALVFGSYSGSENNLRVTFQLLDMKSMKLEQEIVVAGPTRSLTEMENELAWQLLAQRRLQGEDSRDNFRRFARTVPNPAYEVFVLGLGAPDEEGRIKLVQQALGRHPEFPEAHALLGKHYFRHGDCAKAVPRLERALSLEKFFREAQLMLGNCYCKTRDNAGAIRAYSALLPFDPPMEVLNNLGVAYLREGNLPLAVDYLKRAIQADVANPVVTLNLAVLRHLQGEDEAALTLLETILRTHKSHGLGHYLRSTALRARGDSARADEALSQAVSLGIDPEKLRHDDPRKWTQFFISSSRLP